jgi:hypothetical protein
MRQLAIPKRRAAAVHPFQLGQVLQRAPGTNGWAVYAASSELPHQGQFAGCRRSDKIALHAGHLIFAMLYLRVATQTWDLARCYQKISGKNSRFVTQSSFLKRRNVSIASKIGMLLDHRLQSVLKLSEVAGLVNVPSSAELTAPLAVCSNVRVG